MSKVLTLIIKTVERCNLNCSYCYFFNGLDKSYKLRPKFISLETINNIIGFVKQSIIDFDITEIDIGIHGGEPLMQPKNDFIYLVQSFKSNFPKIAVSFNIQTNATLITQKWIDLFNQYNINVGVSFDGPKEFHDEYRVDHQGFGSYDNVLKGIKLLQNNLHKSPGCLTVINPKIHGSELYSHLISVGFKNIDLLLPDFNHDNKPYHDITKYKDFLIEFYNAWIAHDDSSVSIRRFKSIILQLLGRNSLIYGFGRITNDIPILAIRSDGSISPTDELMSTDPNTVTLINFNVKTSSLKEVLKHQIFTEISDAYKVVPIRCSKCCWYNACQSGSLVTRFSKQNRFNNESIYCDALEELFAHISVSMINSGVSKEIITNNLFKLSA